MGAAAFTKVNLANVYILNSGASSYIVYTKEGYKSLYRTKETSITGIGEIKLTPRGTGIYQLQTFIHNSVRNLPLQNTLYIPDAGFNLVSVSVLDQEGCYLGVFSRRAVITRNSTVLFTATLQHRVYIIDAPCYSLAAFGIKDLKLQLWYDRLGYLGENSIKDLVKKAEGLRLTEPVETCEACAAGKQTERPHTSSTKKGIRPLESLYADIAGPFSVTGHNRSRY